MTTRKDFLEATPLLALTPAMLGDAPAQAKPPSKKTAKPDPFRYPFDRARFFAMLEKPAAHRQCFGVKAFEDGGALEAMSNSIRAYAEYLGEPDAVHCAAVLYHGPSIFMAMNDTVWNGVLPQFLKAAPAAFRFNIC